MWLGASIRVLNLPVRTGRSARPASLGGYPLAIICSLGPAVVFHFAAAMPTGQYRRPYPVKSLHLALTVVEQAVVARVKSAWDRKGRADLNRHPGPELKPPLMKKSPEQHLPFWNVVQKQRSPQVKHPHPIPPP